MIKRRWCRINYLYKNEFEEIDNADIGKIVKIIDPKSSFNNKLIYVEDGTFNGFCYKNYNTFYNNKDEVCYIAECVFDKGPLFVDYVNENKEKLIRKGGIATFNSIKDEIKSELEFNEYFYEYDKDGIVHTVEAVNFDNELINQIANNVFDAVDWQTTQAYICETDWCEEIKEYYNKKLSKGELELWWNTIE